MKNFKNQFLFVTIFVAITFTACKKDDSDICTSSSPCTPDASLEGATSSVTPNSDSTTYSVYSDIVINASAAEIWSVLTEWDSVGNWSSSFLGLTGDIRDGGSVIARYKVGTDTFNFPHTLHYVEGVEFGWSDPIAFAPGITDNHLFKLEPISSCQTKFIQTDEFTGYDSTFTLPNLSAQSEAGYNQFNSELKAEVEK